MFNSGESYPWQNATASLKRWIVWIMLICYCGYPWQNATASLKQTVPSHIRSRLVVIRGKTPRPH